MHGNNGQYKTLYKVFCDLMHFNSFTIENPNSIVQSTIATIDNTEPFPEYYI